jgi:hypothetical protein
VVRTAPSLKSFRRPDDLLQATMGRLFSGPLDQMDVPLTLQAWKHMKLLFQLLAALAVLFLA